MRHQSVLSLLPLCLSYADRCLMSSLQTRDCDDKYWARIPRRRPLYGKRGRTRASRPTYCRRTKQRSAACGGKLPEPQLASGSVFLGLKSNSVSFFRSLFVECPAEGVDRNRETLSNHQKERYSNKLINKYRHIINNLGFNGFAFYHDQPVAL